MKTSLKICVLSLAVLGLSACETGLGNFEDAPPYETERTAIHSGTPHAAPAPAPEPKQCSCDCSAAEERAMKAENDLAMCKEATDRVRDAYRDELKK